MLRCFWEKWQFNGRRPLKEVSMRLLTGKRGLAEQILEQVDLDQFEGTLKFALFILAGKMN